MRYYDYVIVGSGIAGLYTALLVKELGSVIIITKGSIDDCNTKYAQGGIAAAIGKSDSTKFHFKDTIMAGNGLCDEQAVRILVNEAPDRITDLVNFGVPFDTINGEIALTIEAAHSKPRIIHAGGDATGEYIEVTLSHQVILSNIEVLEDHLASEIKVDNGTVTGIKTLNCHSGEIQEFKCHYIILATGGAGRLFKLTTNPDIATADGIALAFQVGAEITDMEFFQFHPTALHMPRVGPFLISEAVRGEGGILRNEHGHRFMPDYSSEAEMAPRDIVTRSILYEMEKTNSDKVSLDITHLPKHTITTRFPQIYRFCLDHGLDITRQLIPVAPAAHYLMGGIRTNLWGETNIAGLFAAGETACTGVHGANRLASNSMLEVLIFGKRIMEKTKEGTRIFTDISGKASEKLYSLNSRHSTKDNSTPSISAVQKLHWDKVGIIRNERNLIKAANILANWQKALPEPKDRSSFELNNLVLCGRLMTEAALIRTESRGAHFRTDFPQSLPEWQRHITFTKK